MYTLIISTLLLGVSCIQTTVAMEERGDEPENEITLNKIQTMNHLIKRGSVDVINLERGEGLPKNFKIEDIKKAKKELDDIDWHNQFQKLLCDVMYSVKGDIKDARNQHQFMQMYIGLSRFVKANNIATELHTPLLGITGRVLSISGGGIRGISAAEWLKTLENNVSEIRGEQTLIKDMMHIAGGTSTGGILAAFATLPLDGMTMEKAQKFYFDHAKDIFDENSFHLRSTAHAKYSPHGILNVAYDTVGRMRMSDCTIPTIITSYNATTRNMNFFSSDAAKTSPVDDYYMVDVLRATSAAPSYFTPVKIYNHASGSKRDFFNRFEVQEAYNKWGGLGKRVPARLVSRDSILNSGKYPRSLESKVMVDGGVNVNNPSMQMLIEATKKWGGYFNEIVVVNVGTGNAETPIKYKDVKNAGALQYILNGKLIEMMLDQDFVDKQIDDLSHALPFVKHFKLDVSLEDDSMDNTSSKFMNNLVEVTQAEIKGESKSMIKELSEILAQPMIGLPSGGA